MTEKTIKEISDKLAKYPGYYEFLRDAANTLVAMAEVNPSLENVRRATNVCSELYAQVTGMDKKEALDSITVTWVEPMKYTNKEA